MTYSVKQISTYERIGAEYEVLVRAVRDGTPSVPVADLALWNRLNKDIKQVVEWIFFNKFEKLPTLAKYDCAEDVKDITNEFAAFVLDGVRKGKFTTGRNILGFRRHQRPAISRKIDGLIEKAKPFRSIFLENEEGLSYENPALNPIGDPGKQLHARVPPFHLVSALTKGEERTLGALEGFGGDLSATAAYLSISEDTLGQRIKRMKRKIKGQSR